MKILVEGPIYDPSGLGKIARNLALAFRYISVVRIKPISYWLADPIEVAEYDTLKKLETTIIKGAYFHIQVLPFKKFYHNPHAIATVGLGLFETDRIPKAWVLIAKRVNTVWTTSEFNHRTFGKYGVKNKLVPFCGVDLMDYKPNLIPIKNPYRKKFNFISNFEWSPRKGWHTLLQAYWREFAKDEKVSLTLKTYFGERRNRKYIISQIKQLKRVMGLTEIPTTILCTDIIPDSQMPNFYNSGDCYVSSSRGDGFNLPSLEASSCGLPVIASEWGGDTSYLPKDNLISCEIEPIDSFDQLEICPDMLGHLWGNPSVDNLRHLLRQAFKNKLKSADTKFIKKYGWHNIAENIKGELSRLLEEKNGKGNKEGDDKRKILKLSHSEA